MIVLSRQASTVSRPATSAAVTSVFSSPLQGLDGHEWLVVRFRGPESFLQALNERLLDYADFQGSKQYITISNMAGNDRVSLSLMDYVHRQCLKILGHMPATDAKEDPRLLAQSVVKDYQARGEQAVLTTTLAFDRNGLQRITSRFAKGEPVERVAPIRQEMAMPRVGNRRLRRQAGGGLRSSRAAQARRR